MTAAHEYPKLRDLEIFPLQAEGKRLVGFRDPLRLVENIVVLPQELLFIVSLFDGNHSIRDIQAEHLRLSGEMLFNDQILELAQSLDQHYLLDTPRFHAYRRSLEERFRSEAVRTPILAGGAYEADPEKLRQEIAGHFTQKEGPGSLPHPPCIPTPLKGCIVPHIDFLRGGPCYAWAYKEAAGCAAEVFVLLGTSHVPTQQYFVLTRKAFETPLGVIPTDRAIMEHLESELGDEFYADEILHRNEHSLEFQAVYLSYLFQGKRDITIVPILCGPFHALLANGRSPKDADQITRFLTTLHRALERNERKACLVAAADLAHVGPQFGHNFRVGPAVMEENRAKDLAMLQSALEGDAEGFFHFIRREQDGRNICGLPPIYALLRLLGEAKGELLQYCQWQDGEGNGAVTFASVVFR